MIIKVTKNDIKKGVCKNNSYCPIALAVIRQTKLKGYVSCERIELYNGEFASECKKLPRSARRFIDRFDAKKKVKPFNFRLPFKKVELEKLKEVNNVT